MEHLLILRDCEDNEVSEGDSALEDEDEDEAEAEAEAKSLRVTFLVNVWLDNIPTQSTPFPEELVPKMKIGPKTSIEDWEELPDD